MSKFEEWLADKHLGSMELEFAKSAWNARGKVDSAIVKTYDYARFANECAEAIEKEDEHG